MNKIVTLLILLASLIKLQTSLAQDFPAPEKPRLHALIRTYGDSIVLRWAPDNAAAWFFTNKYGYQIIRGYVTSDSLYVSDTLNSAPLKPMSLEQMMAHFDPSDTLAAIAAQALYGEEFAPVSISEKDGGVLKSMQQQHDLQQMRFAFAMQAADFSSKVAEAMALRFCDKNVQQGIIYDYYIKTLVPEHIVEVVPATCIIQCLPAEALEAPKDVNIRQMSNYRVELIWPRDNNTGFFIERSTDEGKTYKSLNIKPYFTTLPDLDFEQGNDEALFYRALLEDYHIFGDSINAGEKYSYRIKALTSFAEYTPYSEALIIETVDMEPPTPPLLESPEMFDNRIAKISWFEETTDIDLAGYFVEKASSPLETFKALHENILDKSVKQFIDTSAYQLPVNYYRVRAVDNAGNISFSTIVAANMNDMFPPETPKNFNGMIFIDGVVELYWDSNFEIDLKGYRILYANHPDHEFVLLTPEPIAETFFQDSISLNTLTKKIYYKVLAEDKSGNLSKPTEMLILSKPDLVPPTVPAVLNAHQDEENVYITWTSSSSNDVIGYRIFRKSTQSDFWDLLHNIDALNVKKSIELKDAPPPSEVYYEYTIEAIDEAGNTSGICKPIPFRIKGKSTPDISVIINASFDKASNAVKISWECKYEFSFMISLHRAIENETLDVIKTFESSQTSFIDMHLPKGIIAHYAAQVILPDGRASVLSETVSVIIPE